MPRHHDLDPGDGELAAADVAGRRIVVLADMPRGLGPGEPEGLSLFCPRHFAEFDVRTGEVLGGPAPGPLQTYAARVVDGALEIDVLQ